MDGALKGMNREQAAQLAEMRAHAVALLEQAAERGIAVRHEAIDFVEQVIRFLASLPEETS